MPKLSRDKGIRGELEVRDVLRAHGYDAHRGGAQGEGGGKDAPDVRHNIPGCHIEVKRVEAYAVVNRAMAQAVHDAEGLIPLLFARGNAEPGGRKEWLVTLRANDFFNLLIQTGVT